MVAEAAALTIITFPAFTRLLRIKTKSGGITTFDHAKWHPEQQRFHQARSGRDLILKARQVGMTTLELARDVHYARTHEGTQTLIVSQDADLAEVLFQAAHLMVDGLVDLGLCPKPKYSTRREIVFADNHSAIRVVEAGSTETSASKKGRSGTINRLHATEVAFWGAAHETMTALTAAVPADGEVVIESTANGAQGLFYDLCATALKGRGEYRLHFYPWHLHPTYQREPAEDFDPRPRDDWERRLRDAGCTDAQIAWWRSLVDDPARGGIEKVLQEYPVDPTSCFRSPGGAYIPAEACDWIAQFGREPRERVPVFVKGRHLGELLVYEPARDGENYVAAADVAEGTGGDGHAVDVSRRRTGETVATFASDSIEAGDLGLALAFIARRYNDALVAPERNNHGAATLRALREEQSEVTPYHHIYYAEDGKLGWVTTPASRPPLFDELRMAIVDAATRKDASCVITPDLGTIAECKTLVRDPRDGKPRARGKGTKGGATDDRFVAKAIGWQVRQRGGGAPPDEGEGRGSEAASVGSII